MVALIRIAGLTKKYHETVALQDLHLEIGAGEIFGLLGPNGAGKTTTVRLLTTLARPTSGEASINGYSVVRHPEAVKRQIGVVPQHTNLDQDLTARENLELHGRLHRMPRGERSVRIRELLAFVDLEDRADEPVGRFSAGMKRRLMIARALMHRPRVLFLDEPTVGLDPQVRRRIWDLIREMNRNGTTILLTTHYIEEAEMLCHRVGILDRGRLIALGTPRELKRRVGEYVVENIAGGETQYRLFAGREEAIRYAAGLSGTVTIRETNLEDVFVELTGRKVTD